MGTFLILGNFRWFLHNLQHYTRTPTNHNNYTHTPNCHVDYDAGEVRILNRRK